MKKTLIAVAALSAMAASAMAADVTLYGKIDLGLQYNKLTGQQHTTKMESGQAAGSRWGIKTTEDLGNGYKLSATYESGISSDEGKGSADGLFNRDSYLRLDTPYGAVVAGRTGTLADGCTGDMVAGKMTPFGTSYGYAAATKALFSPTTRTSNTIRIESPKFAGFRAVAQYANNVETGISSQDKRYAAVGVSYAAGPAYVAIVGEQMSNANTDAVKWAKQKDQKNITLAANYDFGVAKVFAGYQNVKNGNMKSLNYRAAVTETQGLWVKGNPTTGNADYRSMSYAEYQADQEAVKTGAKDESYVKGYTQVVAPAAGAAKVGVEYKTNEVDANVFVLGVSAPVCGGTAMASVMHVDGDANKKYTDITKTIYSVGYKYSLSKRTFVYGVANFAKDSFETGKKTSKNAESHARQLMVGVNHSF